MRILLCFLTAVCIATDCTSKKVVPTKRCEKLNQKNDASIKDQSAPKIDPASKKSDDSILEGRKDVNEVDKYGYTLLEMAVSSKDLDKVKKLLKLGADPNIASKGCNILYSAVRHEDKEMVSLLLSHGANVVFGKDGTSSVIRYLDGEVGVKKEIFDMILCHLADIGKKDAEDLSPIHWACRDGHLSVVKHLVAKDRSIVNNSNNPYHFTPLHWAARRGFKEIVQFLLSNGATKTATSRSGFTPLMLVISNKNEDLKSILAPDGFQRQSKRLNDDWQCSICFEGINSAENAIFPIIPLDCNHRFHLSCIAQNVLHQVQQNHPAACPNCRVGISADMAKKIVTYANRPEMNAFSILGAVRKNDLGKVRSLLAKGGNPNEQSVATSPIKEAVNQYNYEMVCLLLEYGADPNYLNPSSYSTPLHYAVENMLHERTSQDISNNICIALIKHGALINSKNVKADTPKDMYCTNTDPLFVIKEAGGIRSGWATEIKPAFGLLGDKMEIDILFNKGL